MTINISVQLIATIRERKETDFTLQLPLGSVVGDVLKHLDIKRAEVSVLLVGRDFNLDTQLRSGDTVIIFPPIGGG